MDYKAFKKEAFDIALKLGCTAAETVFSESSSFDVDILEQEIDSYSVSRSYGMGLRVEYMGKNGYAYTEKLEDPEQLVKKAMDNAAVIEDEDISPMQGQQVYQSVVTPENPYCERGEDEKIALAMELERRVKAFDERIVRVESSNVVTGTSFTNISNTLGLDVSRESKVSYAYVAPIAQQGEEMHDGGAFRTAVEMDNIDELVKEAAEEALNQFGASSVDSGEYRVIFRNDTVASFISAFSSMFNAESAQRGLSPLAGREGEDIAVEMLSIVDDPWLARNPRAFDAEGTPSEKTEVITNGKFTSFLHNLKTAKKAGCKTTGNAGRPSPASPVRVSPSNFYIVPGETSYDELVAKLGNGLIITSISGLHAGLNPVSGDYSLLAGGFLVENGKIVRPVDQITVAGTFFEFLKNIECIGSDIRYGFPGSTMYGAPSVLLSKIAIAGK